MSDEDMLAALNVLKRHNKIDSVLFLSSRDGSIHIYLPDFFQVTQDGYMLKFYSGDGQPKSCLSLSYPQAEQSAIIEQWKQAKLAAAFL